jgi:beta-galactosidase
MPLVPTPARLIEASSEASRRVTNSIPFGCPLLLPVHTVNHVQTLKAFAYESLALALAGDKTQSKRFVSLDGRWSYFWLRKFDQKLDISKWKNWPMKNLPGHFEYPFFPGTADEAHDLYAYPIYTNIKWPFATVPGSEDEIIDPNQTPVGILRRQVDVPKDWADGMSVYLHMASVRSAVYVYVNDVAVGYSEGSKVPTEFDITSFLKFGAKDENVIVLKVLRFSSASFLEDQDMWRLTGLDREVYLQARPHRFLGDVRAVAGIQAFNAPCSLSLYLCSPTPSLSPPAFITQP